MMFKECILHVGLEKTGTTSIQNWCAVNRSALIEQGFYYPKLNGVKNHVPLYVAMRSNNQTPNLAERVLKNFKCSQAELFDVLKDMLKEEVSQIEEENVSLILSNEHISSHLLSEDELFKLKRFVNNFAEKVKVVFYLRRQDKFLISRISTGVKAGHKLKRRLLAPIKNEVPFYLDFNRIISLYESVFGQDALLIRIFENSELAGGNCVEDFCKILNIFYDGSMELNRANPSLSHKALEFVSLLNEVAKEREIDLKQVMTPEVLEFLSQKVGGGKRLPTLSDAKEFMDAFKEGNECIRAKYFTDRKSLFDEDFSMYPIEEQVRPSKKDMVEITMILFEKFGFVRQANK